MTTRNGVAPSSNGFFAAVMTFLLNVSTLSIITSQPSIIRACPRGVFSLSLPAATSSPYSTSTASRTCVTVCPLGFYPQVDFKNKPSFADLNKGTAERGVILRCVPCPSKCTACLGPNSDECFVCDSQWIQRHKAHFKHEDKQEEEAVLNSTKTDCKLWDRIRQRERVIPQRSGSLLTVALLVALIAMFSAVLVFSLYRLRWERNRGNVSSSISSDCSVIFDWIPRCLERKKYSAITTQDRSSRAMWSKDEDEEEATTIFAAADVDFRDGAPSSAPFRSAPSSAPSSAPHRSAPSSARRGKETVRAEEDGDFDD